ncbi:MAG: FAD-binding protein [gamma proteobacterium symbiont of Bathyaustriella thionipta]|nr:FAD-binding protein [gamma proteobacterium symbiont of Bathyaustriella thionipta]MCU7948408.1 FAD-binding protein [gamma proteobacterium symbiont of Bathyaustriella thionipta]MCU7954107.1 FAD-binding protein [gamma proteobacterium symbiont of Bathyaustriella thionipta]MCU7955400.1 FAD-binding protein [gamma proteobacterium symbiont of Bathyaustriella thionipta]MCU7966765.1 FAD-binding protein [gamma proteobacterium symbiont of Bathyaustriella thionipta]
MNTQFRAQLEQLFSPEDRLLDQSLCWTYGYDNSRLHALPEAVLFARNHQQIVNLVKLCRQYQVPIISRGAGTGTTGATVPYTGGIILSFERMTQILNIDPANRFIATEPGVTNQAIQEAAGAHNFFWAPDPTSSAICTVGGNLAYNSAGPRAVKYGTTRDNVLELTLVTGKGDTLHTGVKTTKGVVGYDLTRLLIGSEGTLGIITQATLKLIPVSDDKRTLQITYDSIHSAAQAVSDIMAQPIIPCALEFIDKHAIEMIRDYSSAHLPSNAGAMLMVELDGSKGALDEGLQSIISAAKNKGCLAINNAQSEQEIKALWETRKALSPALRKIAPKKINEDVVVPVSRIPELIEGLDQLSQKYGIPIVNFGHAGNGNIHVNLLTDPDDAKLQIKAQECLEDVFRLVLELDGTLSGEHGIGLVKKDYVGKELDAMSLAYMKAIKEQFDPDNILNPGKSFPDSK